MDTPRNNSKQSAITTSRMCWYLQLCLQSQLRWLSRRPVRKSHRFSGDLYANVGLTRGTNISSTLTTAGIRKPLFHPERLGTWRWIFARLLSDIVYNKSSSWAEESLVAAHDTWLRLLSASKVQAFSSGFSGDTFDDEFGCDYSIPCGLPLAGSLLFTPKNHRFITEYDS